MTNLGGHCIETLIEAFDSAEDDKPTLFIAYTVKGHGTPLAGHKDNHSGMMNPAQMEQFRVAMGISEGEEWEPWGGLCDEVTTTPNAFMAEKSLKRRRQTESACRREKEG